MILSILANSGLFAQNTNITLSADQINEVEKDASGIMDTCNARINLKLDSGKLCDAYSTYLKKKCEKVDYLSEYCGGVSLYLIKRPIQIQCIENMPLPNNIKGVRDCLNYVNFNSSYSKLPIELSLNAVYPSTDTIQVEFTIINPSLSAAKISDVHYTISKAGSKLISYILPFSYIIDPVSKKSVSDTESVYDYRVWDKVIHSNQSFVVSGTYSFTNLDTRVTTNKQYNFTYP